MPEQPFALTSDSLAISGGWIDFQTWRILTRFSFFLSCAFSCLVPDYALRSEFAVEFRISAFNAVFKTLTAVPYCMFLTLHHTGAILMASAFRSIHDGFLASKVWYCKVWHVIFCATNTVDSLGRPSYSFKKGSDHKNMEKNSKNSFELGPIRPPSESRSLLIRITRNCNWNKCLFCKTYKNDKFSKRSVDEVRQDIRAIKNIANEIKSLSWKLGHAGTIERAVIQYVFDHPERYSEYYRNVASWLYFGGETVFLQDANSLVLNADQLIEILEFLKNEFPQINRITSYARSRTISRGKSVEDLKRLKQAGLNRLHLGLESGHDPLLEYMKKGATAAEHIDAGKKIKQSGIELSEYVVLGLGGKKWWKRHAVDTARVLNEINPDFIRMRSLKVLSNMPLYEKRESGEFQEQSEEETVKEERLFIETLDNITSHLVSDHILNLLMEIEGVFPGDKRKLLDIADHFLKLPDDEKINFSPGKTDRRV